MRNGENIERPTFLNAQNTQLFINQCHLLLSTLSTDLYKALSFPDSFFVDEKFMSGFRVSNLEGDSLMVFHLLFVDDTLIFCDTDLDQLLIICLVLLWFEAVSGFKINLGKSELVHVGQVYSIELLVDVLGCKLGLLPMRYLGLPLGAKFKEKSIWNPIMEKVGKRLVG